MELWGGVYDSLSARLATEAGYDWLWLSSYSVSAAVLGLPDEGHVAKEMLVDASRRIGVTTGIPTMVDAENGFGSATSDLQSFASDLLDAGARGLCIEDTVGPKQCSLWEDIHRDLRRAGEMATLLGAMVDVVHKRGGRIVARTEALVEGHGVEAAEARVRQYAEAGCWGVVVHFRDDVNEAFDVARRCRHAVPLVLIPTRAPEVSTAEAERRGFAAYVAANVGVRASARALSRAYKAVLGSGAIEPALVECMPLQELDSLLGRRQ